MRLLISSIIAIVATIALSAQAPVPCSGGIVALTYDDGPEPQTMLLLDQLKLFHLKATFFLIGQNVQLYPDIARRIVAEGHQIGNHTWDHTDLTLLTDAQVIAELANTQTLITAVTGVTPAFARPPYGSTDFRIAALMQSQGLVQTLWSQDSKDWTGLPRWEVEDGITVVPNGGIYLMHSRMPNTTNAVGGIAWYFNTYWQQTPICAGRLEYGPIIVPILDWHGMFSYVHSRVW